MFRKLVAVTLLISFVAMATSGMMMFVIEKPSFTIQMHPVHKLFGLVMILAVMGHLALNGRVLFNHLKTRSTSVYGGMLVMALVLLYGVAMNNEVPEHLAMPMNALAAEVEMGK
ncbi:MAG: DUF4405 domain-containing protein [Gammaproteobacteria bacterium]|nr:DUF4405 domain-containing protein [Gammaproteobacteria bacterium]